MPSSASRSRCRASAATGSSGQCVPTRSRTRWRDSRASRGVSMAGAVSSTTGQPSSVRPMWSVVGASQVPPAAAERTAPTTGASRVTAAPGPILRSTVRNCSRTTTTEGVVTTRRFPCHGSTRTMRSRCRCSARPATGARRSSSASRRRRTRDASPGSSEAAVTGGRLAPSTRPAPRLRPWAVPLLVMGRACPAVTRQGERRRRSVERTSESTPVEERDPSPGRPRTSRSVSLWSWHAARIRRRRRSRTPDVSSRCGRYSR